MTRSWPKNWVLTKMNDAEVKLEQRRLKEQYQYEETVEELVNNKRKVQAEYEELRERVTYYMNDYRVNDQERLEGIFLINQDEKRLLDLIHKKEREVEMKWEEQQYEMRLQQQKIHEE